MGATRPAGRRDPRRRARGDRRRRRRAAPHACGSATRSTSRSRTSSRSASRPASRCGSTACSTRSGSDLTMAEAKRTRINAFGIAYEGKTGLSTSSSPGPPEPAIAATAGRAADGLAPRSPRSGAARRSSCSCSCSPASAGGGRSARCAGMDDGPWTALGTLGWFVGVWVVMMAAMMFPSVAPTVALYARMTQRALAARAAGSSPPATCRVGRRRRGRLRRRAAATARARPGLGPPAAGRRRDAARRGRLRADAAQGRLPRQVPQPTRLPARLVARRPAGALRMGARTARGASAAAGR